MINKREQKIINFIKDARECSSKKVFESAEISVSYATLKRILTNLRSKNYLVTKGKGQNISYHLHLN